MRPGAGHPRAPDRCRVALIVACCLAATLAAAPGALAAGTVSLSDSNASFTAGAGDVNNLTITANPGSITFNDTGAVINEAEADCAGGGTNTVTCTSVSDFGANLGDQDDTAIATGGIGGFFEGGDGNDALTGSDTNTTPEILQGGAGNDVLDARNVAHPFAGTSVSDGGISLAIGDSLSGADGNDELTSGSGNDGASGGAGTDVIRTGEGDDSARGDEGNGDFVDLGPGNDLAREVGGDGTGDVYMGGPGVDRVSLESTQTPPSLVFDSFALDLAAGTGGQTAPLQSADTFSGFEDAAAQNGNDSVIGTVGPNQIVTGGGADTVNPLAGADLLRLQDGDDSADVRDGFPDRVLCGAGTDSVQADQSDELVDCELPVITATRPAAVDSRAPKCRLTRVKREYPRRQFLGRGVRAQVSCDEPVTLVFRLVVPLKAARRGLRPAKAGDLVLAERSIRRMAKVRRVRLRAPKRLRGTLPARFRARVFMEARDEFGNRRRQVRRLRVRG